MNNTIKYAEIEVPSNADEDDCLTAAAKTYIAAHPMLRGYDLSPRWTDDATRETVTLTVPRWAVDGEPDEVTDEQISQLRAGAGAAGDLDQVAICDRALQGDEDARNECADVLTENHGPGHG